MNQLSDTLKDRLRKLQAMAERGATEGEKKAARLAMKRICERIGIDADNAEKATKYTCFFTYQTNEELGLLFRVRKHLVTGADAESKCARLRGGRTIRMQLDYENRIVLECAYEYFRKHMKAQWKKAQPHVLQALGRKRGKKRKMQLERIKHRFFSAYIIASKLCSENEIIAQQSSEMTEDELRACNAAQGIEGGNYKTQLRGNQRKIGTDPEKLTQKAAPVAVQTSLF